MTVGCVVGLAGNAGSWKGRQHMFHCSVTPANKDISNCCCCWCCCCLQKQYLLWAPVFIWSELLQRFVLQLHPMVIFIKKLIFVVHATDVKMRIAAWEMLLEHVVFTVAMCMSRRWKRQSSCSLFLHWWKEAFVFGSARMQAQKFVFWGVKKQEYFGWQAAWPEFG